MAEADGHLAKVAGIAAQNRCKEDRAGCELRDGPSHQPRPGVPARRWLLLSVVFEVQRKVVGGIRVVGLVVHDRAARGVVDRVQRRSRPDIQSLHRE